MIEFPKTPCTPTNKGEIFVSRGSRYECVEKASQDFWWSCEGDCTPALHDGKDVSWVQLPACDSTQLGKIVEQNAAQFTCASAVALDYEWRCQYGCGSDLTGLVTILGLVILSSAIAGLVLTHKKRQ